VFPLWLKGKHEKTAVQLHTCFYPSQLALMLIYRSQKNVSGVFNMAWCMHSWHDTCIHGMVHAFMAWHPHSWHDACINGMVHAFMARSMHSWNGACIHGMASAFMEWCIHSWHGACILGKVHAFMEWCMHSISHASTVLSLAGFH